ncbi:CysZ protein [Agromyces terreus]|uniref:CysZ protein n=1 Tax=Agromyces terreus TaxID=424795 RepID=A0A9X2H569_9MICO|nr:EI24 domain-containing protein [Agromyces terreus]MCP2369614.1 CysZ protein [Agromyces terreus]
MIQRFLLGVRTLLRGFGFWRRQPGTMMLGLVPAAIVWVVVLTALVALGFSLPGITVWATPFAAGWVEPWATIVRTAVGAVVLGGAIVLAAVTFTGLTLMVGDPFYERIWRAVEADLGGEPTGEGIGFWRSAGDAAGFIALGMLVSIGVALSGLLPIVGGVLAPVLGVVLSGRLLAWELTGRAFESRGIGADERSALLRGHRSRLLGFGIATQLCFMVPLGAIFTMPAAVAGATMLARGVLDDVAARPAPPVDQRGATPS